MCRFELPQGNLQLRNARLVVDTGMHAMSMTLQEAEDYMFDNYVTTSDNVAFVKGELLRYVDMPGQALAYKMGEKQVLEFREEASRELGDKFDLRAFHQTFLSSYTVPLKIIRMRVRQWIAKVKSGSVDSQPVSVSVPAARARSNTPPTLEQNDWTDRWHDSSGYLYHAIPHGPPPPQ